MLAEGLAASLIASCGAMANTTVVASINGVTNTMLAAGVIAAPRISGIARVNAALSAGLMADTTC